MKIKKYIKQGLNKYKVVLEDNTSIVLYEDIILKYELLLKKEISNLDTILKENNKYELYDKCLNYLNKKLRSESEIKKYLQKYTSNQLEIDNIIDESINLSIISKFIVPSFIDILLISFFSIISDFILSGIILTLSLLLEIKEYTSSLQK